MDVVAAFDTVGIAHIRLALQPCQGSIGRNTVEVNVHGLTIHVLAIGMALLIPVVGFAPQAADNLDRMTGPPPGTVQDLHEQGLDLMGIHKGNKG